MCERVVCERVVCERDGGRRQERQAGVHNQKQEPHTNGEQRQQRACMRAARASASVPQVDPLGFVQITFDQEKHCNGKVEWFTTVFSEISL